MRIELKNVNTNKLHEELVASGIVPSLVESLDNITWITIEDNKYDAVMSVVAVHSSIATQSPIVLSLENVSATVDSLLIMLL